MATASLRDDSHDARDLCDRHDPHDHERVQDLRARLYAHRRRPGSPFGDPRELHVLHHFHQSAVRARDGYRCDRDPSRGDRVDRLPVPLPRKEGRMSAAGRRAKTGAIVTGVIAYLVTFLIVLPLLWIVLLSFQPSEKILN